MNTLRLQTLFVVIFVVMVVTMQCLFFLSTARGFFDAIFRHQWTWIIYFFVSLALTERVGRWLPRK